MLKASPRKKITVMKELPSPTKETVVVDKLVHLEHVEDNIINSGRAGLTYTMLLFKELHKLLVSPLETRLSVTEKYDGSPSVVFGRDPQTTKFFVATKSFFSKTPKINFSEEDIQENHGYSEDLVQKLTAAFHHLPKVVPVTGVFQGDLMYTADTVGEDASFTANTVTYSCRQSFVADTVRRSKLGIVVHTEYTGNDLQRMSRSKSGQSPLYYFRESKDVFLIPEKVQLHEVHYPKETQEEVLSLLNTVHLSTSPNIFTDKRYEVIKQYKAKLKPYINKTVREGTSPFAESFADYLNTQLDAETLTILKDLFYVHSKLQHVKDILHNCLYHSNVHRPFETSINGVKTKGEGFVVSFNDHLMKIVDRQEFSRQNFLRQRAVSKDAKTTVFAFARMNPPHKGHGLLIHAVKDMATKFGADHLIAVTATHDSNNPLPPAEKLAFLNEFFPGTNFVLCEFHFIHELRKLYQAGTRHLILAAGGDRVDMYEDMLNEMNGKDEFFYFPRFEVVSVGARRAEATDIRGMSGTKMREYARLSDFHLFAHCAPNHENPALIRKLFEAVQQGPQR